MKKPSRRTLRFVLALLAVLAALWALGNFLPLAKHEKPLDVRVRVRRVVPEVPAAPTPETLPPGGQPPPDERSAVEPPISNSVLAGPSQAPDTTLPAAGDEKSQQLAAIMPPPVPSPSPRPRGDHAQIAIVLDDLGLDLRGTKKAIELPSFVTLSFMSYATRLREQTKEGRDRGHELLLHMPMEPTGHADPGPGALLVALPPDEIRRRFQNGLASFAGFDGVNNHMGSKFTADTTGMEIVIDELQQRHLFFLDSRTTSKTVGESLARQHGLPTIGRDVFLDDDEAIGAVRNQMEQAERIARRKGSAVVIGHPHPATLEALSGWIPDAQARGFVFVPLHTLLPSPN
ncbi:MAG: divergent polysaccharide deacetylase family protein [Pseudomonadota bacterium]|nr:divergent polysaccharide deacetylase family protein [Pseudomonadota bacterium]